MAGEHEEHGKEENDNSAHEGGPGADERIEGSPGERSAPPSDEQNPPRTTTHGWWTSPKFGSSTSGGGEIEPGPERD